VETFWLIIVVLIAYFMLRDKAMKAVKATNDSFNYIYRTKQRIKQATEVDELIDIRIELSRYGEPYPGVIRDMITKIDQKLTNVSTGNN
jgi:hypothetical protein